MKQTTPPPTRSTSPPGPPLRQLAHQLFGAPALPRAKRAPSARERYAEALSGDVPGKALDAFEAGHAAAQEHGDAEDAFLAGFSAGAAEKQRARAAGASR